MFGTATVIFIFLMQFIMNFLDQLVGKGLDTALILELITYNIAWMLVLAAPMGVLFSTLLSFGSMSAAHEITIIKASGGSFLKMMSPVIIAGFLLSILLFWFNDAILPDANHNARLLMSDIQRKKPTFALESGQFSSQLEGYTILARSVDSATGLIRGITIYDMSQLQKRNIISADTAYLKFSDDYRSLILDLYHGEIHQLSPNNTDNYRIVKYDKYKIALPASGFALEQSSADFVAKGDRELDINDMQQIVDTARANKRNFMLKADSSMKNLITNYIYGKNNNLQNLHLERDIEHNMNGRIVNQSKQQMIANSLDTAKNTMLNKIMNRINIDKSFIQGQIDQAKFYDSKIEQYQVEIYKKYAIPFACLIFVFVGSPLGIITKGGNFGISSGISLVFYVIYWISLIGGEKLADRGILEPWLAMWLGNIIIGLLGLILTLRVNYESLSFLDIRNIFKNKFVNIKNIS